MDLSQGQPWPWVTLVISVVPAAQLGDNVLVWWILKASILPTTQSLPGSQNAY